MTDYIYALLCPQGEIRYIGKTTNPKARLAAHICKAKTRQTNHHAANWIRSLLNSGEKPAIEIVFEVPNGEPWEPYEVRLIEEFKSEGHRLTNSTGGGDGFFDVTPDVIAKRVAAAKITKAAPGYRERISAVMREVRSSPEYKKAASDMLTAAWKNEEKRNAMLKGMRQPEAVERRSAASSRRYDDPSYGAAHSERLKELHRTNPEVFAPLKAAAQSETSKAKRRESLAKVRATPEYKAKNISALNEIKERPEVKAKKAAAARAIYEGGGLHQCVQSEEFKADQAERLKGRWKDPEAKAKMQDARWSDAQRAKQAAALEARREKMKAAMTPEVRAAQGFKMKAYWAKKREEKLAKAAESL